MKLIARGGKRKRAKAVAKVKVNRVLQLSAVLRGAELAVDRASVELRRGLPVIVVPAKGPASLVALAEMASEAVCEAMARWSGTAPHVLLTRERANTLKIRLYTEPLVAVLLPEGEAARSAHVLADPTRDMGDPLMGPWKSVREPFGPCAVSAVRLAKISGSLPALLEVPVKPAVARKLQASEGLASVTCAEIAAFENVSAMSFQIVARAQLPLGGAEDTRVLAFRPANGAREHLALVVGSPEPPGPVLVRLHSECLTGDLLGSLKCDCGDQLRGAVSAIGKAGAGVLLYLAQEGRGIGLVNKLKAYELQDQGFDTVDANRRLGFEADERRFAVAAEILKKLGFASVRLMTNNPDKVAAFAEHGIEVVERVAHQFPTNPYNAGYLATKKARSGHLL